MAKNPETRARAWDWRGTIGGAAVILVLLIGTGLIRPFHMAAPPPPAALPATPISPVVLPRGASRPSKPVLDGATFFSGARYVGSESCRPCHARQYEEWRRTWHARMLRPPTPAVILPDFDDPLIAFDRVPAAMERGRGSLKISPRLRLFTEARTTDPNKRYFFTLLDHDDPANNQTYEITAVIGGNWAQQFLVRVGDNRYPTPFRWVVADGDWLSRGYRVGDWFIADGTADGRPRRPEELVNARSSEAKCAGCHSTGFIPDLTSRRGKITTANKGEPGIGCEACHGPGSRHAESEDPGDIIHGTNDLNALQQSQLCGRCHHRGTNRLDPILAYPVGFLPGDTNLEGRVSMWHYSDPDLGRSNHFWPNDWAKKNRQQWQDFQKSTHFLATDVTCLTCHTFHWPWYGRQLRLRRERLCVACHTARGYAGRPNAEFFAGSPAAHAGVTCVDCHMAKVGERCGPTATDARRHWDVSSHTLRVATPERVRAYGLPSACQTCHDGEGELGLTDEEAGALMSEQQATIRRLLTQAQAAIEAAQARGTSPAALAPARVKVDTVLLDGSLGFHNYEKARALLEAAIALAGTERP